MQPVAHVAATLPEGDWDCLAERVEIRHGRDDPTAQPEADAATIELLGPVPDGTDIGTPIQVYAALGGENYPRFAGTITDIAIEWETPDTPLTQIIAVGHLARMGHLYLTGAETPEPVSDVYTDGGADPAVVVRGTPHFYDSTFAHPGMQYSTPNEPSAHLGGYSGILYDYGGVGDFDVSYEFDIVSPGIPASIWLARSSATTEDAAVLTGYGFQVANYTVNFYSLDPAFAWIDNNILPGGSPGVPAGVHTVRIRGVYTGTTQVVFTIDLDGVFLATYTLTGSRVHQGPWFGPYFPAGDPSNRIRMFSHPGPVDMDGTRANWAIAGAGVPTDAGRTDSPGTIHIIPRAPDKALALNVAHEAAEDGGGVLWETRDGVVLYADALHRDDTPLTLDLPCETIPLDITWVKNLDGLVNDITLTYYEGETSFEQHVWDDDSIAAHGTWATSLGTRIAGEGDAVTRASRMLFVQAEPAWRVANVGVQLEMLDKMGLDPAEDLAYTGGILDLEMHQIVKVAGMPYGAPINPSYLFIEGWTETITFGTWHIGFAVSDYCQTGAAETWDEVDGVTTWHTYEGGAGHVTWDHLPCHPPPGA